MAQEPHSHFQKRRQQFSEVSIEYFTHSDLNHFQPLSQSDAILLFLTQFNP